MDAIIKQIKECIKDDPEFRYIDKLSSEDSLVDSGVVDSMSLIKLVSLLEQRFNIKIDAADVSEDNFNSLKSIAQMIEGKRS